MEIGPRVLDDPTRNEIVGKMQSQNFSSTTQALIAFAYYVPRGKRFSQADAVAALRALDFDTSEVNEVLGLLLDDALAFEIRRGTTVYHMRQPVRHQLAAEGQRRHQAKTKSSEPEAGSVSMTLRLLQNKVSGEERVFLDETVKCLEVEACRAAIVMGWNLAYDHVRRWIFEKRLAKFNTELTSRYRIKSKKYDPVVQVEDFPDSERFVLEVCRAAQIIDKNRITTLKRGLDKRNQFAHPSGSRASAPMAAGHISDLLENVVLDPFFS